MHFDVILVGHGISGTFLSHYLQKAGFSFMAFDQHRPHSASNAAAGLINPVTGRRFVKTWMIESLMGFAKSAYEEIGKALQIECIAENKIIDFFATPQMRNAFLERLKEDGQYIKLPTDENDQRPFLNYDFGYGEIGPVLLVALPLLVQASRSKWKARGLLSEDRFDWQQLRIDRELAGYQGITADRVIFCDGMEGFSNPYFSQLPFAPNKGEALVVEIRELPDGPIFKKGIGLVPLGNHLFWVGSSYEWEYADDLPTSLFRDKTISTLKEWLKMPFQVREHFASVRPATLERRPFVGFHPIHRNLGMLNGMGTKGCSLAPFFAAQLVQHIQTNMPIEPLADLKRFDGILRRAKI